VALYSLGVDDADRKQRVRDKIAYRPGEPAADKLVAIRRGRLRPGARRLLAVMAVVLLFFIAVTVRLFIWPADGMPAKVDAILMVDSPQGDTLGTALRLAHQHRAPYLLISLGSPESATYKCPGPMPHVKVVCFIPKPATTQGEAEFFGHLARRKSWHSVVVVTMTPQASRTRLRVTRCFAGNVYVVTAAIPLRAWPYQLAYQWGALIKAFVVQRSC